MIASKKDFVKIALQLSHIDDDGARNTAIGIWVGILKNSNPRFDEARFRRYIEDSVRERRIGH